MNEGAAELAGLADGARRVARWTGHLPRSERREALASWFARCLAGRDRADAKRLLRNLADALGGEAARSAPEVPDANPALEALVAFAREYSGDGWVPAGSPAQDARQALEALTELAGRLRGLAGSTGPTRTSLRAVVDLLAARQAGTDAALKHAAQESFDRLLEAMNPQGVEPAGGVLKIGPFHRAGLYDAWCEKYRQLLAYHRAGRLVADLRSSFRKWEREEAPEEKT